MSSESIAAPHMLIGLPAICRCELGLARQCLQLYIVILFPSTRTISAAFSAKNKGFGLKVEKLRAWISQCSFEIEFEGASRLFTMNKERSFISWNGIRIEMKNFLINYLAATPDKNLNLLNCIICKRQMNRKIVAVMQIRNFQEFEIF